MTEEHEHEDDEGLDARTRRALADYAPPPLPQGLVDRVVAATSAPGATSPRPRGGRSRWVVASALAVAVVALLALGLLTRRPAPPGLATHVAVARETLRLGARAVVVLEPGAAIAWDGDARVQQLAGTASYEVAHGGRAFVVVTPAGTVTDLGTRFEVEVSPMDRKQKVVVTGAAVAVALGVYVSQGRVQVANGHGELVAAAGERVRAEPDQAPQRVSAPTRVARKLDVARVEKREALLRAIAEARAKRQAAAAPAPTRRSSSASDEPPAPQAYDLDKDYIRQQVRAVLPLLVECYDSALRDSPGLAGDIVVTFTVSGEPGVGGLVTSSAIDPKSTISDAAMAECVSETMYAVELEPPSGGGEVTITYPFSFSP